MNARQKILHCDDDPDLLDNYREALTQLPSQPEVLTANSGPCALAMLEAGPFDLLICDLMMPEMNGLEVLEIVRRKYPQMRTMILTALEDEEIRSRAYALGVDMVWKNPVTEEETKLFLKGIRSLLERKLPGSVEQVDPGAKPLRAHMAADTLATAKKEAPAKPVFTVLIGHQGGIGDVWEMLIKQLLQSRYDLRFFRFGDDGGFCPGPDNCYWTKLLHLVAEQPFDLILVYSHMLWGEIELFARLRAKCGKPVIACSDLLYANTESCDALKAAGIGVLPCPHSIEQFMEELDSCVEPERNVVSAPEIAAQPRKTRPLRIVVLDDEEGPV